MRTTLEPSVRVLPLQEQDIPDLVRLARDIWYRHFPGIISLEQIEYMLAQRYGPELIREQLADGSATWLKLTLDGAMVAFASYAPGRTPETMRLDKLYVRYDLRGRGYGGLLLRHVEDAARACARTRVELQVNKNNRSAIEAYQRYGYRVGAPVQVDIGGGFMMDDYVMSKDIGPDRCG